jgi:hypothetical protein
LKFADLDRIDDGDIRVSVGAVNVRTGNLVYFDNTKMRLEPEHFNGRIARKICLQPSNGRSVCQSDLDDPARRRSSNCCPVDR